ncbi:MAG: DinB family protein, partial [bacterium]
MNPDFSMPARELASLVEDARRRTRQLVDTLDDAQWQVPRLDVVNPPLWEVGHVGNFYETFVLR